MDVRELDATELRLRREGMSADTANVIDELRSRAGLPLLDATNHPSSKKNAVTPPERLRKP